MRRILGCLAGLVLCSLLLAVTSLGSSSGATPAAAVSASAVEPGVISPASPIKHVVIIYQENHTFDDVLGQLCQERTNPCDGYTGPVTFANGTTAPNIVQPDIVPAAEHSPKAQKAGMNNEWNEVGGCQDPPYKCVSHIDPAHIPNLASLANTFTVSDRTFAAGQTASFVAHVTLGAGTLAGFVGANPVHSIKRHVEPREGWGCRSRLDARWGPRASRSYEPSCIPDQKGKGPYRRSRVPYTPTIMERMEQAGQTWHMYEGTDNQEPIIGPWSVCTYFAWCWLHRFDSEHNTSRADFVNAATNGTLPGLSMVLPTGQLPIGGVSQHNGNSMGVGDNYIGDMVSAVANGPEWESTVIFITYDDCGCFYDHVTPPGRKMGLRNPMVIVSPWAKPQGTDSGVAIQPYSMLAFTEHLFGLAPLTKEVTRSYDYADSFDFTQEPIKAPVMTHQKIPRSEWAELRRLAPIAAEDPA